MISRHKYKYDKSINHKCLVDKILGIINFNKGTHPIFILHLIHLFLSWLTSSQVFVYYYLYYLCMILIIHKILKSMPSNQTTFRDKDIKGTSLIFPYQGKVIDMNFQYYMLFHTDIFACTCACVVFVYACVCVYTRVQNTMVHFVNCIFHLIVICIFSSQ